MNKEIISEIRNKLQSPSLVLERLSEGKILTEKLLKMALNDFDEANKLINSIEIEKKSLKRCL